MVSDDRAEHNHSAITDSPESWISADVFSISSPPELLSAPAPVFDSAPPPAHPAGGPQWEFSILAEHDPAGGAQWQNSKPEHDGLSGELQRPGSHQPGVSAQNDRRYARHTPSDSAPQPDDYPSIRNLFPGRRQSFRRQHSERMAELAASCAKTDCLPDRILQASLYERSTAVTARSHDTVTPRSRRFLHGVDRPPPPPPLPKQSPSSPPPPPLPPPPSCNASWPLSEESTRATQHVQPPAAVWAIASVSPAGPEARREATDQQARALDAYDRGQLNSQKSAVFDADEPSPVHRRPPSLAVQPQVRSRAATQEAARATTTVYSVYSNSHLVGATIGPTVAEEMVRLGPGVGFPAGTQGARAPSYFVFS